MLACVGNLLFEQTRCKLAKDFKGYSAETFLGGNRDGEGQKDTSGLPNPKLSKSNQKLYMKLFFAAHSWNEDQQKN